MRSLRRAGLAFALGSVLAANAASAFAADNGTVDATVTVATPCILLGAPIDYGTLPFSQGQTPSTGAGYISYNNCSTTSQRVFGRATDATGPGPVTWSLLDAGSPGWANCAQAGLNTFQLNYWGSGPAAGWLSTTDKQLETVAAGVDGTVTHADMYMPCVGSDGAGATMSFQITFTATF